MRWGWLGAIGLVLWGCGAPKPVELSLGSPVLRLMVLQNKIEIHEELKVVAARYHEDHPEVEIRFETAGGDLDYNMALATRLEGADAPDIFSNEGGGDFLPWKSMAADLTDEPWTKELLPGMVDSIRLDGRIYGFPLAVEGFGFAYNKAIFAKAGILSPPTTLQDLEKACRALEARGFRPFSNAFAVWWSLGSHYYNVFLAHQPNPQAFLRGVEQGRLHSIDSPWAEGWLDLLDLMTRYGQPGATVSGTYPVSLSGFLSGQAAMVQQGNWIQPELDKWPEPLDLDFLPLPLDNSGDRRLSAGVPNFLVVNRNSPRLRASLDFLTWLATTPRGRQALVGDLKMIPAFRSDSPLVLSGLNRALDRQIREAGALAWVFPWMPTGTSERIGASLRQYIDRKIDRQELWRSIDLAIVEQARRRGP